MSGPFRIAAIISLGVIGLVGLVIAANLLVPPLTLAPLQARPTATVAVTVIPRAPRYTYNGDEMPWVQQAGLLAWLRASQDRDGRGQTAAMRAYDFAMIKIGDDVTVLARQGEIVQIENARGIRGWTTTSSLTAR